MPSFLCAMEPASMLMRIEFERAIYGRNPQLMRTLLDNGANPDWCDEYGDTVLMWIATDLSVAAKVVRRRDDQAEARARNKIQMCQLLLERGAQVNVQNKNGNTALIFAVIQPDKKLCRLLLEHGANVNAKNIDGSTALSFCLMSASDDYGFGTIGHEEMCKICQLLLRNNANIEQLIPDYWPVMHPSFKDAEKITSTTVLIKAAELKDVRLCRLFVDTQAARIKAQRVLVLLLCLKNSILKNVLYKECKDSLQPYLETIYCKPIDLLKIKDHTGKMAFDYLPHHWLNPDIE